MSIVRLERMLVAIDFFHLLEHALAFWSKEANAFRFNVYAQRILQQNLVKREKLFEKIPLVIDCY